MSTPHAALPPRTARPGPRNGRVVFIGAGPGAADLITVRGARWLAQADVVLFDALADPALRELAPRAQWIDVGKRGFSCEATSQTRIDALLVQMAQRHALVVRLKGGDPSVFGRLEEELQALAQAGVDCEVVPGVTAAIAAAADTQRPLTRRGVGRSVSLTTAMTHEGRLQAGRHADTEVFYMAGKQLGKLARALLAAGWPADVPVCVVSRAGWPDRLASEHHLAGLASAALLHAGRPTVVTVGAGAAPVAGATMPSPPSPPSSLRAGASAPSAPTLAALPAAAPTRSEPLVPAPRPATATP